MCINAMLTGYKTDVYSCANTNDRLFLLSYVKASNVSYGLGSDLLRKRAPSAYALAQGTQLYGGENFWLLRSPSNTYSNYSRNVTFGGGFGHGTVDFTASSVVPALWLSL